MVVIDDFLKIKSPESLIEMWARKDVCWELIKQQDFDLDYNSIKDDFLTKNTTTNRKIISLEEIEQKEKEESLAKIKSIPYEGWKSIENWGRETKYISTNMLNLSFTIANRIRSNKILLDNEISNGLKIIDVVIDKAPEILFNIDIVTETIEKPEEQIEITIELIQKIVQWDKQKKRLKSFEYIFLNELAEGKKLLTERNKALAKLNLEKVIKYGFRLSKLKT